MSKPVPSRRERIGEAAKAYCDRELGNNGSYEDDLLFIEGAEWADANQPIKQDLLVGEIALLRQQLALVQSQLDVAVETLKKNADEDYRGNRSSASVRSFEALAKIAEMKAGKL